MPPLPQVSCYNTALELQRWCHKRRPASLLHSCPRCIYAALNETTARIHTLRWVWWNWRNDWTSVICMEISLRELSRRNLTRFVRYSRIRAMPYKQQLNYLVKLLHIITVMTVLQMKLLGVIPRAHARYLVHPKLLFPVRVHTVHSGQNAILRARAQSLTTVKLLYLVRVRMCAP